MKMTLSRQQVIVVCQDLAKAIVYQTRVTRLVSRGVLPPENLVNDQFVEAKSTLAAVTDPFERGFVLATVRYYVQKEFADLNRLAA